MLLSSVEYRHAFVAIGRPRRRESEVMGRSRPDKSCGAPGASCSARCESRALSRNDSHLTRLVVVCSIQPRAPG